MTEKRATREAFGETLIELAKEGVDVVAVDADLSGSTTTAKFGTAYPTASSTWASPSRTWSGRPPAWRRAAR